MKGRISLVFLGLMLVSGAQAAKRPNIIFILTDDLDFEVMDKYLGKTVDGTVFMPYLKSEVVDRGTTFQNFYVTYSACCPSRATILRGQYPHNTDVRSNNPPVGGFQRFYQLQEEQSTLATWFREAGYRTVLVGKYLNEYPSGAPPDHVPPGWTEWYATGNSNNYFNYTWIENGKSVTHGSQPNDYFTDVVTIKALDFIRRNHESPFFAYLAPIAPHIPFTPAPRHEDLFPGVRAPRSASFNEDDISDKPSWMRNQLSSLSQQEISVLDREYRDRMRCLMSVDQMIGALAQALKNVGQYENTIIAVLSDNGFQLGQHRLLFGKGTAYEEDIHVPFFIAGPGIPAGRSVPHLSLNNDIAPTFADLAGIPVPDFVDGRSLGPLFEQEPPPVSAWRAGFLIEFVKTTTFPVPDFYALRTMTPENNMLYVEWSQPTGSASNDNRELYAMDRDPHQLDNEFSRTDPALLAAQASKLKALKTCVGAGCKAIEDSAGAVVGVSISPMAVTLHTDGSTRFSSKVTGVANAGVSWEVEEGSEGGEIDSGGNYVPPPRPGTYHVVGRLQADPSRVGRAVVTVQASRASEVRLNPLGVVLPRKANITFTASTANPDDAVVAWSVDPGGGGGSITPTGTYTAPDAFGTYLVAAASRGNPHRVGRAVVTVQGAAESAVRIAVNVNHISLAPGGTFQFGATISGSENPDVQWEVVEGVHGGRITADGFYTAPSTPGEYRVRAVPACDPGLFVLANVDVIAGAAGIAGSRIFPNPWRGDQHEIPKVTFDQLSESSKVDIFSLKGKRVKTLPAPGGVAEWDLTNESSESVASGYYLYVITDASGNKSRGKLAIVR